MTKVKAFTTTYLRQLILWFLLASLVALIGYYIYLVNASVFNILSRTESDEKLNLLSSQLSNLEGQYLTLSSSITLDQAKTLGLLDASKQTHFVNRTQTAAQLSLPPNEI